MNKKPINDPLLTVITLTKDSSKHIEESMISLKESLSYCENKITHLVIDGNSKDNTTEIIQNILPSSLVIKIVPHGIYNAINHAIKNYVTSPYVTYLHSDDMYDKNYLKYMLQDLECGSNKNVLYVGTIFFINEESKPLYKRYPPIFLNIIQKYNNLIFHPNVIYPTSIEKEFPYREDIGRTSDYDHISKIMVKMKQKRVKKAIYMFRISKSSTTFIEGKSSTEQHNIFSRIYIHLFETKIFKRLIMKLSNTSYWR